MRLESGSHSPFRRPVKEGQPIDPQHRGPVVRRLQSHRPWPIVDVF